MRGLAFNNLSNRQFILGSVLLLLIAFVYLLPVCFIVRGNSDQGLIPLGADLILRGKFIYKDMLTVVWHWFIPMVGIMVKTFGETWLVAKTVLLLSILAIVALLFALSRNLIKGWLVFVPATILFVAGAPPWGCNYYHWDSLLAFIACTFVLTKLVSKSKKDNLNAFALAFFAGILASLSICCMQSLAPTLLAGLASAACLANGVNSDKASGWKGPAKIFLAEILGLACVLLTLLAYLVISGTLHDCINYTITFNLHNYESINREPYGSCSFFDQAVLAPPSGNEAVCISNWIIGGLVWLPFEIVKECPLWVLIGIIIYKVRGGSIASAISDQPEVVLFIVLGFGFWLVEFHRPDINRLLWGSQLLLILLFYFAEYAFANIGKLKLTVAAFACLTVVALAVNAASVIALYQMPKNMLKTRWHISSLDDLKIIEVIDKLTQAHDKVLVYPYDTTINFLSQTSFPSVHPLLQYHFNSKQQMESSD